MKHDTLRSVGHNIAVCLANGIYDLRVFEEACRSREGHITVDFLSGTIRGGKASPELVKIARQYSDALPRLCQKHRVCISDFAELYARYWKTDTTSKFLVTIQDRTGRRSITEYSAPDRHRIKIMEKLAPR